MSQRRRARTRVSDDGGQRRRTRAQSAAAGGRSGQGGGNQGGGRRRKKRNRGRGKPADKGAGFWGDPGRLPKPQQDVRITDDPAAVARSLGPPPLPGHEKVAEHYFTVVYERAVTTAGALAAAGGLIDPDALAEELAD